MSSGITSIYAALAAISVAVGSKTPTVYSLASIPDHVDTAILPCRILLPMGNNPTGSDSFAFVGIGSPATVHWQLVDLMLWEAGAQGTGISGVASDLVTYCGAYVDAMRTFKAPTTQSALTTVSCVPGVYEFPSGSGFLYKGVLSTLTIEEALVG